MDTKKILNLVEKCIEKSANDFLDNKAVDYQALQTLMDAVRIAHHAIKMSNTP